MHKQADAQQAGLREECLPCRKVSAEGWEQPRPGGGGGGGPVVQGGLIHSKGGNTSGAGIC